MGDCRFSVLVWIFPQLRTGVWPGYGVGWSDWTLFVRLGGVSLFTLQQGFGLGAPAVLAFVCWASVGGLGFLGLFFKAVLLVTAATFIDYISSGSSARTPCLRISPAGLVFAASNAPTRNDRSSFRVSAGHR